MLSIIIIIIIKYNPNSQKTSVHDLLYVCNNHTKFELKSDQN